MRDRTRDLHVQAERTGIIADILRGRSTRGDYALLLRNLLPVYQTLEGELTRHRRSPSVEPIIRPELARCDAIRNDLEILMPDTPSLPILSAATRYVEAIIDASGGDGSRMVAHAYVRYLGDLSGGQIVKRLIAKSLDLSPEALTFYDFPAIADIQAFKADYMAAIDHVGAICDDFDAIVEEGARVFELNIALSVALQSDAARRV